MVNNTDDRHYSPYLDSTLKRCVDIFVSVLLLLPMVFLVFIISMIVLIVDGRAIFFFQRRAGKNGVEFLLPKIRTLENHAPHDKPTCMHDVDAVATKTGSFLRHHRLDELPQLFSVLIGKMSLVGPRPELPGVVNGYSQKERKRLCVRPGLTGLWQIRASRSQPIHENIRYDLYYLRHASLWLDIRILAETVPFAVNIKITKNDEKNRLYPYQLSLSE